MVLTRSNTKRRKVRARRTYKRRRFNISRPMRYRPHGGSTMTVTKTWWSTNWTPNTASVTGYWRYFGSNFGGMPETSMFSSIFETYRINWIKYTFRPRYDNFSGNDTTDTTLPGVTNQGQDWVHVIIDPKSLTVPSGTYGSSTLNSFLQSGRVRTYKGSQPFSITIKYPCIRDDLNGVTNAKARRPPFIDCAQSLEHYGAHIFIQDVNMTGTFGNSYDVFTTMNVTFKGQK